MSSLLERLAALPLWPMLVKELRQLRRDRFTLALMIGIPAIQLVMFGYAIRTEVRHLPTVVLDEAQSSDSRALVDAIINTGNFDRIRNATSRADIQALIGRGEARAAIIVPPDFTRDLKRGRTATVQVIVDAADPMASSAAMSGASLGGQQRALAIAVAGGGGRVPLEVRVRPWYNPMGRSSTYIVPGIVGLLLSVTLIIIMSVSIVRERERGTLEQLVVTPIGRTSLMLGKILPFVLIGYVQMTVILGLGRLLFDVPLRGSLLLLYVAALGFIGASLGIGLLVSTLVRTQAQAMQLGFLFLMPNLLLSGFMFPREAMPAPAQWLGAALPLTYFLEVLRGILLKGVGAAELWPAIAILAGFAVLSVALSVRRFRKTVE